MNINEYKVDLNAIAVGDRIQLRGCGTEYSDLHWGTVLEEGADKEFFVRMDDPNLPEAFEYQPSDGTYSYLVESDEITAHEPANMALTTVEGLDELPPNSVILCQMKVDTEIFPEYVYVKKQDGTWLSDGPPVLHGRYISEPKHLITPHDTYGKYTLIYRGYEPTQEQIDAYMAI